MEEPEFLVPEHRSRLLEGMARAVAANFDIAAAAARGGEAEGGHGGAAAVEGGRHGGAGREGGDGRAQCAAATP